MQEAQRAKAELLKELSALRKRVSQLERAEQTLQESEEKWRSLVENVPDIIVVVDRDGTVSHINRTVSGIAPEKVVGKSVYDYVTTEHHDTLRKSLDRVFQTGQTDSFELVGVGPNDTTSWYESRVGPIKSGGQVVAAAVITKNITERRKAEDVLQASERKYRDLVEQMSDVIYTLDTEGNVTSVNKAGEATFGRKPEEVIGKSFTKWIPQEDLPNAMATFKRVLGGEKITTETVLLDKETKPHNVEFSSTPIVQDGKIIGTRGIIRDITERKRAEDALRKSDQQFKVMFENTAIGMYRTTPDGRILMANSALVRMLGFSSFDELSQRNLEEEGFEPSYQRSVFKERIERQGQIVGLESQWMRRDGTTLVVIENARVVRDDGGDILYYEGTAEDITERKKVEERLRASEQKFKDLTETTTDWIWEVDKKGIYTYVSPKVKELLGYEVSEVLDKTPFDLMPEEEAKRIGKIFKEKVTNKEPFYKLENVNRHKDGHLVILETNGIPVFDEKGQLKGYRGVDRDITERKKAEDALRESEEKFRTFVETASDLMHIADNNLNITDVNESMVRTLGYSKQEMVGMCATEIISAESLERDFKPNWERYLTDGEISIETNFVTKDGREIPGELKVVAFYDNNGEYAGGRAVFRDMTERKNMEQLLREERDMVQKYLDVAGVMLLVVDADETVTLINRRGCDILGYSEDEIIGKNWFDTSIAEPIREQVRAVFRKLMAGDLEPAEYFENPVMTKSGEQRLIAWHNTVLKDEQGNIVATLSSAEDITACKQAQEQLARYREEMAHTERLASLGIVGAALAHELNQPLTVIRLSIENSLADLETTSCPGAVTEGLKDSLDGVSHAVSIIDRLRNFARRSSKADVMEVDLKAVAERVTQLLDEQAWRAKIAVRLKNVDKLPPIYANKKDLEQLFFALIENAIQAVDGKKDHHLTISATVKGQHIELRFSDDCGGIVPENLDKIFEPFFTTKAASESTGLGLCIVQRIVSQAGGKVRVESKAGKGSTFLVTLPITEGRRF